MPTNPPDDLVQTRKHFIVNCQKVIIMNTQIYDCHQYQCYPPGIVRSITCTAIWPWVGNKTRERSRQVTSTGESSATRWS